MSAAREKLRPEKGMSCVGCGNPIQVGQCVVVYDDEGEVHRNCFDPYHLDHHPEMSTYVLIGRPMKLVPVEKVIDA